MSDQPALPRRLTRWRHAAHAVLWVEYAATLLWAPLAILAAAAGLALLGIIPPGLLGPLSVLAAIGAAVALAVRTGRVLPRPSRDNAERRLEADSALRHRPFAVLRDAPAAATPGQMALWQLHRARASAALARLRLNAPAARLATRDPFALRAASVLLLIAGLIAAGPDAGNRLLAALLPSFGAGAPAPVLQAWIEPPAYTGLSPIFLAKDGGAVTVPAGSKLTMSLSGGSFSPHLSAPGGKIEFRDLGAESWQASGLLTQSGTVTLRRFLSVVGSWKVTVLPNTPPVVDFPAVPERAGKSLETKLPWHTAQRWGVASLSAALRPAGYPDLPPITLPIPLPGTPKDAKGALLTDLSAHPYAGVEMEARLTAKDVSGQTGERGRGGFRLPPPEPQNGLARAIIELRRRLALDKETPADAAADLDVLAQAPKLFSGHAGLFLNTVSVAALLRTNHSAEALAEAQQRLWIVALALDGALPEATQQALDDAVKAMQRALDQHAQGKMSDSDLARAMEKLRQAMAQRLNDLARQAAKQGKIPPFDPQAQRFSAPMLDRMMQQMEQAAREGRQQDAQDKLAQLQKMLEKLQNAHVLSPQEAKQAEQTAKKGRQLQGAVQDLTQREAGLMDRAQARTPRPMLPPQFQPGPNDTPDTDQLEATEESRSADAATQRALRQALEALKGQLGGAMGQVPKPLNDAAKDMESARDALTAGQEGRARQAEGKVIDDLRKGGQEMAKQMAAGQQLAIVPGGREPGDKGEEEGMNPGGEGDQGQLDPLGRPLKQGVGGRAADDNSVKVPDEMEQLRSRAIQDELRRRGGQLERPRQELDYIDRLLKPF
jgi:uncharacterized protein (TIGR02302 family)